MFPEMRRKKQQLSAAECEAILLQQKTAVLSLSDPDGYPYAVPVNYVYCNGKIYFHCAKSGHKLDLLVKNPKLSLCVIDRDCVDSAHLTDLFRSVIVFGTARILSSPTELLPAIEALGLKFNPDLAFIREEIQQSLPHLCCVEIVPDHITGKQAKELIHQSALYL